MLSCILTILRFLRKIGEFFHSIVTNMRMSTNLRHFMSLPKTMRLGICVLFERTFGGDCRSVVHLALRSGTVHRGTWLRAGRDCCCRDRRDQPLGRNVDGIAVSVNDADALKESINRAVDAGIPVVTFDSDAPASKRTSFYGTNNYGSGKTMGEHLVKQMGAKGTVALLMGTPGAPNLEERKNGFLEYLKNYPDITVTATEYCYDDVNQGVSKMEAVMQAHPDLKGWILVGSWAIFTPAPGPFASRKPGDLTVIAFDALPEEFEYVRQGYVQTLIGQKLWGWGYESVRLLKDIRDGKNPERGIDSGVDIVTKDNVEEYTQKWKTGKF